MMTAYSKTKTAMQVALFVYVAALFFSPPLSNLAELVLYLGFFAVCENRRTLYRLAQEPAGKAFSLFMIAILVSVAVGIFRGWTDWSVLWSMRKLLIFPIAAVIFYGDDKAKSNFLYAIVAFGGLIALYGIVDRIYIDLPRGDRMLAPFNGMLLAAIFTSTLVLLVRETRAYKILALTALCCLLLYAIILVGARSAYLASILMATVVAVVVYWFRKQENIKTKTLLLVAVIISASSIALLLHSNSQGRIIQAMAEFHQPLHEGESTSIGQRKIFYANTIEMLEQYYLIGSGAASFERAYKSHIEAKGGDQSLLTRDPHNQFLKIWIEQGMLGLIAFLAFLTILLRNIGFGGMGLIGGAVLLGWMCSSLFNGHFGTFTEGRFIWAWMGIFLVSAPQKSLERK